MRPGRSPTADFHQISRQVSATIWGTSNACLISCDWVQSESKVGCFSAAVYSMPLRELISTRSSNQELVFRESQLGLPFMAKQQAEAPSFVLLQKQ